MAITTGIRNAVAWQTRRQGELVLLFFRMRFLFGVKFQNVSFYRDGFSCSTCHQGKRLCPQWSLLFIHPTEWSFDLTICHVSHSEHWYLVSKGHKAKCNTMQEICRLLKGYDNNQMFEKNRHCVGISFHKHFNVRIWWDLSEDVIVTQDVFLAFARTFGTLSFSLVTLRHLVVSRCEATIVSADDLFSLWSVHFFQKCILCKKRKERKRTKPTVMFWTTYWKKNKYWVCFQTFGSCLVEIVQFGGEEPLSIEKEANEVACLHNGNSWSWRVIYRAYHRAHGQEGGGEGGCGWQAAAV